jgi:hypothetical protein
MPCGRAMAMCRELAKLEAGSRVLWMKNDMIPNIPHTSTGSFTCFALLCYGIMLLVTALVPSSLGIINVGRSVSTSDVHM